MKNATKTFRKISIVSVVIALVVGICLAISVSPALAQFFLTEETIEKIDIINPTPAEKRYSTTTFASVEEYEYVKEEWQRNEDILNELKEINKNLKEMKYVWQKR